VHWLYCCLPTTKWQTFLRRTLSQQRPQNENDRKQSKGTIFYQTLYKQCALKHTLKTPFLLVRHISFCFSHSKVIQCRCYNIKVLTGSKDYLWWVTRSNYMERDMIALFEVSLLSCHVLNENSGKPQKFPYSLQIHINSDWVFAIRRFVELPLHHCSLSVLDESGACFVMHHTGIDLCIQIEVTAAPPSNPPWWRWRVLLVRHILDRW